MSTATRRTLAAAATAAGLGLLVVGCSASAAGDAPGNPVENVTLRVGIQNSGSSAPLQILRASGVLQGTPYTVQIAEFDGSSSAVEALNAGAIDVDIALNSAAPVLAQANAEPAWDEESAPFRVVGAVLRPDEAGIGIVVDAQSGITSVADLRGRTVSFAPGTANHYYFALAAADAGLDTAEVEVVTMPLTEARAAYLGGSVDALVTAMSNCRALVAQNGSTIIADSSSRFTNYQFLAARPEVLDQPGGTEAVGDLLHRLQLAEEWEAEHQQEVADIYATVAGYPEEEARLSAAEGIGRVVPIDEAVYETQQSQADVFLAEGVATQRVDVRIGFDDRYNDLIAEWS